MPILSIQHPLRPSQQNMPLGYHDGPRLVKVPGNVTWWQVTGLQPNSLYLVRLMAINEVGASRPTPRLRLTTDQESPEGTATDIRAISNASQSILVTWKVLVYTYCSYQDAHISPNKGINLKKMGRSQIFHISKHIS